MTEKILPLGGLKILDVSQAIAGPLTARLAIPFGANVIHIERPGVWDLGRRLPPFVKNGLETDFSHGTSIYFISANASKKAMGLDTTTEKGQEILHRLVAGSDVVIANRPSILSLEENGLDINTLARFKPDIILIAISMLGHTGPEAGSPGYDLTIQSRSGSIHMTTDTSRFPGPVVDVMTAMNAFNALLLALLTRDQMKKQYKTEAQFIDVSLLNSFPIALFNLIAQVATFGKDVRPEGRGYPFIAPYTTVPTQDGFLTIAIADDSSWKRLMTVLKLDTDLCTRLFGTNADRVKNAKTLEDILIEKFMTKTAKEWSDILKRARVPAQNVLTIKEFLELPQTIERGVVDWVPESEGGSLVGIPGNPLNCSGLGIMDLGPAPEKGQHTNEILGTLDFSASEIRQLREKNIVG